MFSFKPLLILTVLVACNDEIVRDDIKAVTECEQEFVKYANARWSVFKILSEKMPQFDAKRRFDLAETITSESLKAGFDPLFILALIETESRFDHEVISPTGARGLMQILPSTWEYFTAKNNMGKLLFFDECSNATVGIRFVAYISKSFRRPESVLLAYNQGPAMATRVLSKQVEATWEGANFAPAVLTFYKKYLKDIGLNPKHYSSYWRSPERTIQKLTHEQSLQVSSPAVWESMPPTCQ